MEKNFAIYYPDGSHSELRDAFFFPDRNTFVMDFEAMLDPNGDPYHTEARINLDEDCGKLHFVNVYIDKAFAMDNELQELNKHLLAVANEMIGRKSDGDASRFVTHTTIADGEADVKYNII